MRSLVRSASVAGMGRWTGRVELEGGPSGEEGKKALLNHIHRGMLVHVGM